MSKRDKWLASAPNLPPHMSRDSFRKWVALTGSSVSSHSSNRCDHPPCRSFSFDAFLQSESFLSCARIEVVHNLQIVCHLDKPSRVAALFCTLPLPSSPPPTHTTGESAAHTRSLPGSWPVRSQAQSELYVNVLVTIIYLCHRGLCPLNSEE